MTPPIYRFDKSTEATTSLTPGDDAQDISGQDAKILDAYLWADWDVANMPLNVKAGKQVFNWGEALFVRDGINTSNPVDAAAFRLPGAEIKEVLIPTEALGFNLGVTDNLSLEGYYQWAWTETVQDPVGTYYSNDDLFSPGGNYAYNDFAGTPLGTGVFGPGVLQGSCRVSSVFYAAIFSAGCSLSGLSVTVPMGCQFRVAPDQRCGC